MAQAIPNLKSIIAILTITVVHTSLLVMSRAAQRFVSITPRDIEVITWVYSLDGCQIADLRWLWPQGDKPFGPRNSCYRRIGELVSAGYLRAERLGSASGLGRGPYFLTLGPRGRALLAERLQLSKSDLHRLREIRAPFVAAHHLAICQFRTVLTIACRNTGLAKLVEWKSERELRIPPVPRVEDPRPSDGRTPHAIPLIPDGEFTLAYPDGAAVVFKIEQDMGTIPRKRLAPRLRAQLLYSKQDHRPFLWVLPNKVRLDSVADWAQQEARLLQIDPSLIWLTTQDRIDEHSILHPIWQVLGGPLISLVPDRMPSSSSSIVPGGALTGDEEGSRWNS